MNDRGGRTALVTGGSGFIGRAMVREVEACGYDVRVFDRTENGGNGELSILNADQLASAVEGVDAVYHLAGVLGTTELLAASAMAVDVNVLGTVRVLDACRDASVRRVFLCTKPNDWLNTYSITKRTAEEFGRLYAEQFGLDVRILRWLNAYGPGQKAYPVRKAVPWMILQALYGRRIEIFGSGEQPVDLIYVDDLARVTVAYTEMGDCDATVRDTGLSIRMTVNEMARLIKELTRSDSPLEHLPMRPGEYQDAPVQLLDGPTACDLAGVAGPPLDLHEGMERTIDYYRQWPRPDVERVIGAQPPGRVATAG